ncbi:hypothetical protein BKA82DRAFT_4014376 [Pisolithus tinctorius]|nr:hypothetical protein BKA82DRAFT_4014376 [Pisolithus tinctorius]
MSDYYWQQSLPTPLQIDYIKQIIYKVEYADPEETMVKVTSTNLYLKITEDRVLLPGRYFTFIKLFLWRYYLLMRLHLHFQKAQSKPYANFPPHSPEKHRPSGQHHRALIRPSIEMDWGRYRDWIPDCFIGEEYDWEVDSVPDEDLPKMWDEVVDWYSQELDPLWMGGMGRGLGSKDEEKGTDAGGSDGEIDPKNMSDVDQDMAHGDDTNAEIGGNEDHGGEGGNGGEGRNENEEEGSEGSNDMGKNDGGGEQDSDVPLLQTRQLAVTQKRRLSEGSNEEEGGQRKRPSPNPPAARPDREGDQPIGFSQDLLQMIGRPLPPHWSPPLDSDMIESQVDFPLESFCQGASVVNESLDPTPFPVAAGDDEMATHGDIPPVNQRSGGILEGGRKERGWQRRKNSLPQQLLQSQKSSGTLKREEVATFLKTIPGIVRSLAKGCKDGADGINEQFKQFFMNLRAISKSAAYLGLHLQKMERMEDTVIDINVKKGYLILANQSGLGMKKNA